MYEMQERFSVTLVSILLQTLSKVLNYYVIFVYMLCS